MIYTLRSNQLITFTDHTGVTFVKNEGEIDEEILTGPFTTIETSPANRLSYNNVNWAVAVAASDIVLYKYDGLGNYQDPSGDAMEAQTFQIINCLDPTVGATGLNTTFINSSTINLAWVVAPDFEGMTDYRLFRNNVFLTNISLFDSAYIDTGLDPSTNYAYRLESYFAGDLIDTTSVNGITTVGAANLFAPIDDTSFLTADNLLLNHNGA